MNKWFFINTVIVGFLIWKLTINHIAIHTFVGGISFLFILYNWTRHAVFSTIRSNISRQRKVFFAKIAKVVLPAHKWTGTTALLIAMIHATLVIYYFGLHFTNLKMISGLLALVTLIVVVIFGWLRHLKTTVIRRYIHWGLAYLLIFLITIHLII